MRITFALLPLLAGSLLLASCASNPGTNGTGEGGRVAKKAGGSAAKPDHEPSFDYWQNGGGACCPYHAQMFQAEAARKSRGS
jgi:hypothetical protein